MMTVVISAGSEVPRQLNLRLMAASRENGVSNPCIFILKYMDENIVNTKQDGTDRLALGRWRPWISMGRPVLPGPKLEQLPGLVKPASFARLSRAGGS